MEAGQWLGGYLTCGCICMLIARTVSMAFDPYEFNTHIMVLQPMRSSKETFQYCLLREYWAKYVAPAGAQALEDFH